MQNAYAAGPSYVVAALLVLEVRGVGFPSHLRASDGANSSCRNQRKRGKGVDAVSYEPPRLIDRWYRAQSVRRLSSQAQ